MICIDNDRSPFAGMFDWCRDSMIQSYFEGRIGTGLAGGETARRWAAVRSGDFLFCAGEPEDISRLIGFVKEQIGADALIIPQDADRWQAALAEENILPIYEELVSEDIKYLANRFKESLIEFRLHRSEKTRTRVFEEYLALRREMRDCDDF